MGALDKRCVFCRFNREGFDHMLRDYFGGSNVANFRPGEPISIRA